MLNSNVTSPNSVVEGEVLEAPPNSQPSNETAGSEADRKRLRQRETHRRWVAKHREHRLAYLKAYNIKRKEKGIQYRKNRWKEDRQYRDACLKANREWKNQHKEEAKATKRKSYQKHRIRLIEKQRLWYRLNREQVLESASKYRNNNRDRIAHYYKSNREKIRAKGREYDRQHPDKRRLREFRRKRRLKDAHVDDPNLSPLLKKWLGSKTFTCFYCQKTFSTKVMHIDHVHPVSRGGRHESGNICRSCSSCNLKKSSKLIQNCVVNGQQFLL